MNRMNRTVLLVGLSLAGVLPFLAGCTAGHEGRIVTDVTIDQLRAGMTTRAELLALMGEPTEKIELDGGMEMYVYGYRSRSRHPTKVYLLLMTGSNTDQSNRLHFEIRDNVVQRFWDESYVD